MALIIKQIVGITLFVFSAFGLLAFFSGAENYFSAASLTGMTALLLGLSFGYWMMRVVRKQKIARRIDNLEAEFPAIVEAQPELSPARLAKDKRIPRKAAKEFLERKASELPATVRTDEKGRKTYNFGADQPEADPV